MKLVRYGTAGRETPGVILNDQILDVRGTAFDMRDYDGFFFENFGIERVAALARESRRKLIPADSVRLGPPIARPGKIICVGKNYADHAKEFDSVIPKSPVLFSKATTTLSGPHDPILIRDENESTDAEAELAVVIGKRARNVAKENALDYVAGFSVVNDVTDRNAQKEGVQWYRGKSFDTFCPMGPWLITRDEFDSNKNTRLTSRLNGNILQDGNTGSMMFDIPFLISFISQNMTLEAGDLIATGTPAGVGFARNPPVLLKAGDVIECGIEGIGTIRNRVTAV